MSCAGIPTDGPPCPASLPAAPGHTSSTLITITVSNHHTLTHNKWAVPSDQSTAVIITTHCTHPYTQQMTNGNQTTAVIITTHCDQIMAVIFTTPCDQSMAVTITTHCDQSTAVTITTRCDQSTAVIITTQCTLLHVMNQQQSPVNSCCLHYTLYTHQMSSSWSPLSGCHHYALRQITN